MKIAFVATMPIIPSSHGVRVQALTWKKSLEEKGHQVEMVNMWDAHDWRSFDVIECFVRNEYLADFVSQVSPINPRIALAPIIDVNWSPFMIKLVSYWGSSRLRLSNTTGYYSLRKVIDQIKLFHVRSAYEKTYLTESYGISSDRVCIVPLSYRLDPPEVHLSKESFCLHVSLLADERKNVKRLIEAANKYQFKLVLAGKLRNETEKRTLENCINGSPYVEYLGFVSDEQLIDLYQRASVFALPSTYEGVGLVALEAAVYGCDIVITNLGGPKEYYGDLAAIVDPYNVDQIGLSIKRFLDKELTFQPQLSKRIMSLYNSDGTSESLLQSFERI